MNAKELDVYLAGLGKPHDDLVHEGVLSPGSLVEIYPGSLSLYRDLLPGVELSFWAEDQKFEKINISLSKTALSDVVFQHELPAPYDKCRRREEALEILGEPFESRGPHKMPSPLGESGGWDKFHLPDRQYPELTVIFSYDVALNVTGLVFALKRTGYDRDFDEAQHEEGV